VANASNVNPRHFIGLLIGLFLAVLAFSQSAASLGVPLATFRPLGGSFFSERSRQFELAKQVFESKKSLNPQALIQTGQRSLIHAPLAARSLWLVGMGMEKKENTARARRAMQQAHRVSRRDSAVELWIGQDSLRQGEIKTGLRHYDLMMRGNSQAAADIMPRMALVIMSPEGRQYLTPYIRDSNPWVLDFLQAAAEYPPRSTYLAQLLLGVKHKLPDVPNVQPVYAQLVRKLFAERQYKLALQLYPRLPGATRNSLSDIDVVGEGGKNGDYPPFVWDFVYTDSQDSTVVSLGEGKNGIELYGAPGTVGIAASKLIAPKGSQSFRWTVVDKTTNLQASANWDLTCLLGKSADRTSRSVNLLSNSVSVGKAMQMALIPGCELYRLDMRIAGGIGRTPAGLTVGELTLSGAAKP
jgi:hypothetical protein